MGESEAGGSDCYASEASSIRTKPRRTRQDRDGRCQYEEEVDVEVDAPESWGLTR